MSLMQLKGKFIEPVKSTANIQESSKDVFETLTAYPPLL